MWHEARRQERKIRGMMVDYRRRAERRREFYEKIVSTANIKLILQKILFQKADPTQFLQLHGRQCKIHLDPAVASAADSSAAMCVYLFCFDKINDLPVTPIKNTPIELYEMLTIDVLGCLGRVNWII